MSNENNTATIMAAIANITTSLERAMLGVQHLKTLVPHEHAVPMEFDPKDPANKYEIGGLNKLTDRGIEICYRLFDAGLSRHAVANEMDISHGGANHRFKAWEKVGGVNRQKHSLNRL